MLNSCLIIKNVVTKRKMFRGTPTSTKLVNQLFHNCYYYANDQGRRPMY